MLKDITLHITNEIREKAPSSQLLAGHLGTHFDCMNKDFPLEYAICDGYIFDVRSFINKEIGKEDVDLSKVEEGMFVGFYSGHIDTVGYGSKQYHDTHPVLSHELIDFLIEKKIKIIGVDFIGVRKGKEHTPMDQYCADHHVFIVENLCHMQEVCERKVRVFTFPMSFEGMSGLPCRVVVEY